MKAYPKIPANCLWTIATDVPHGEKPIGVGDYSLKLTEYPEDVYGSILEQAQSYAIVSKSVTHSASGKDEYSRKNTITPDCIVVKDHGFAGVFTLCTHEEVVHLHTVRFKEHTGILFADGTSVGINYDEFEGCPGGFFHTCTYALGKG